MIIYKILLCNSFIPLLFDYKKDFSPFSPVIVITVFIYGFPSIYMITNEGFLLKPKEALYVSLITQKKMFF